MSALLLLVLPLWVLMCIGIITRAIYREWRRRK